MLIITFQNVWILTNFSKKKLTYFFSEVLNPWYQLKIAILLKQKGLSWSLYGLKTLLSFTAWVLKTKENITHFKTFIKLIINSRTINHKNTSFYCYQFLSTILPFGNLRAWIVAIAQTIMEFCIDDISINVCTSQTTVQSIVV